MLWDNGYGQLEKEGVISLGEVGELPRGRTFEQDPGHSFSDSASLPCVPGPVQMLREQQGTKQTMIPVSVELTCLAASLSSGKVGHATAGSFSTIISLPSPNPPPPPLPMRGQSKAMFTCVFINISDYKVNPGVS